MYVSFTLIYVLPTAGGSTLRDTGTLVRVFDTGSNISLCFLLSFFFSFEMFLDASRQNNQSGWSDLLKKLTDEYIKGTFVYAISR